MSEEKPPNIDAILGDGTDYFELSGRLDEEANGDRLLLLLRDVMRMMMASGGDGKRFEPFIRLADGSSSLSPELLTQEDVALLSTVQTDNAAARARVADLLWERTEGKDRVLHVQRSIDAYLDLASSAPWHEAEDYLRRASQLAGRFRGADEGVREEQVRNAIRDALDEASEPAKLIGASSLLRAIGESSNAFTSTVKILDEAAAKAELENDLPMARALVEELRAWMKSDDVSRHAATARIAEMWAREAEARASGQIASALVASSFIENAIQGLRSIPRAYRKRLGVDERVTALRRRMIELNEAAMDEMTAFETAPVDLSGAAAIARESVAGQKPMEALLRFSSLFSLADQTNDRAQAEQRVAGSIASLFSTTTYTHDGRVSDKSTADEAVERQMGQDGQLRRHLYTVGMILPALHQIREEHSITLSDFADLALQSPAVPPGTEGLMAAGLHAGWNLDMGVALHVLVPRVEAIVRYHLKSAGVITTHLDQDGREDELSLPALLAKPETSQVFSDSVAYELEGLFAGRFGSNLRHDIAHGLLDDGTMGTIMAVYAWWFILRLTLTPFFSQMVGDDHLGQPAENL